MEKKTKKFIIEVEEGETYCGQCPDGFPCGGLSFLHCCDYNLATMKITEMKIKIEIDVPTNSSGTKCKECPFKTNPRLCMWAEKRCNTVDFTEMAVKEVKQDNEGKALLYAVGKAAERTKREVIKKAAEWFEKYLFDVGYPDDWLRDSPNLVSGRDRFIKAMKDESK